jgi:3-deoxy-D-manno-octulosonic-acid transferase
VAAALVAHQALEIIVDVDSMTTTLRRWAADAAARRDYGERAKEFVAGNRGTLQRLLAMIAPLIAGAKSP